MAKVNEAPKESSKGAAKSEAGRAAKKSPKPAPTPAEAKNRRILIVLFLGVLMGALDIAIVGPALPALRTAFGVDDRAIAWVFSIYVLFNLIGAPLMSKLSDRYGRRNVYLADVVLFGLGSLGVALAPPPAFGWLLAARAVQGFSAGGIWPVASAVIGDTFPQEKKGSALGLIGAVFGLAFILGPILGGLLLMISWQWLFLVNLPLAALIIFMGIRVLPATRPAKPQPFDMAGMAVLAVLLGSLAYGVNQIDTENLGASLGSTAVWPFLLTALIALPLFAWIERRASDPVIRPKLLGSRQLRLTYLLSAGAGLGEAAMVFLPALAVAAFGMSHSRASFMLMPVVLAMMVGSPLGGRLLNGLGSRTLIAGGTAFLGIGMVILGFFSTSFVGFMVAGAAIGLGLSSLLGAPIRYITLNEAPVADRTAAQGMVTISTGVGQLISGALVGAAAASRGGGIDGYAFAYVVVAGVSVVLLVISLGLKNRAQEQASLPEKRSPVQA
ncbi:MAG: MFS transporter [Caldilineaceae bacterium]|nr:MFS transporter [Caldilineaceae bacterium]MBP8106927.1 MFS transporter [Caldilineaceae bacterium]MBP8121847.1 MFS transporter [Caldilineaceae bacterium]MBP9072147.1 MFS transporter [Caldilineaceae bacterium]